MQRTLPYAFVLGVSPLLALPCAAQEEPIPADAVVVATPPVIVIELVPAEPVVADIVVAAAPPPIVATQYQVLPPVPASAEVDDATEGEDAPASERLFSVGISGLFGARDGGDGPLMTWSAGVDLAYRVAPWARLGLRRTNVSFAETSQGERYAIGATPVLDLSVPLGDVVEPFAELGVSVQARLGGRSPSFGLAPVVSAGTRFHVIDWLSLGAEVALTVPVTEHVLIGHELFPRASILVQIGASVEARF